MATPEELFEKRLDHYIDRYAERIGYARTEELLQDRAQDMRELTALDDSANQIEADDLEGWND